MGNRKASNFIAQEVYTQDGDYQGYILSNIYDQDFNKLIGFQVVDDEKETEKFLPAENIKFAGKDCIFARELMGNYDFSNHNNPIGKKVFDCHGNLLGQVKDVRIFGKKIKSLILQNKEILAKNVHFIGKNCIILNAKLQKNTFLTIKSKLTGEEPKVEIQAQSVNQNYAKIGQGFNAVAIVSSPKKIILNPPSLLNKVAAQDIFGMNNELIIKKGQIINQQKIDLAKKHGKLNLLIINSK